MLLSQPLPSENSEAPGPEREEGGGKRRDGWNTERESGVRESLEEQGAKIKTVNL